jgi:hypothetical protein
LTAAALLSSKSSAYVFHEQHEVEVVGWAGLELGHQMHVEVAGVGAFGVDDQASTTYVVRELGESSENVLEHAGSKPCAFVVDVDAESSKQSHRLGVAAGAFAQPAGSRVRVQLGHAPGVIGDHAVTFVLGDDKDFRRANSG